MENLIGRQGEKALSQIGFTRQLVSMGHQACGALELWNYPLWLRDIIPQDPDGRDRPDHVDLPALEGIPIILDATVNLKMISLIEKLYSIQFNHQRKIS